MARGYIAAIVGLACLALVPRTAAAIPAFARKYGTSCTTCHTIYPKLNPFGEAFRRNGFRFPGTDSDMVKAQTVSLGSEAYKKVFPDAVWPGTLPGSVPLSIGFNGQLVLHPQSSSGAAQADGGQGVVADNLVEEGHLWAGGSFDDAFTFFSELTVSADAIELERAIVSFNDLVGPDHLVNMWVGKASSTLTSFGPHSSYLADSTIPALGVTGLFGATSGSWTLTDNFQGVELSGVAEGIVDYSLGINAGTNSEVRSPKNAYAHVGVKLGGMRMDAEEKSAVPDANQPWAETAVTLDAFYYHSESRYTVGDPETTADDIANAVGGMVRAQWMSLEFDAGIVFESHSNPEGADTKATAISQFDELSYVVFPWLVPAARFEYTRISPDGGTVASDSRLTLGVAGLLRPNIKLVLSAQLEAATGVPPGGWGSAGGFAILPPESTSNSVSLEVEAVTLGLAFAY